MMDRSFKWRMVSWVFLHMRAGILQTILLGVCVFYPFLTWGLVGLSKEHAWISSFIEVSIAVNSAMLVTDVRKWFVDRFRIYSRILANISVSNIAVRRNDMTLARLGRKMKKLEIPLLNRLQSTGRCFSVICFMCILAGTVLLLTDARRVPFGGIPLLLWPFVCFYATLSWHLCWALDQSQEYCQKTIQEKTDVASQKKWIDELVNALPESEDE
jgi:hypothetical protein